jgi:C4-dicarboxylate-binding protein DctP
MKAIIGIGFFIFLGLFAALLTGFGGNLAPGSLPYDEVQEGLNDRIIIKFSHVVAENTPKGLAAEKFAQLAAEKTHGRVEVQVYPNGILYSDQDEVDALMGGEIQMIAPAFSKLSSLIPAWLALDLPFAFRDQAEVDQALQGEIGQMLFRSLEQRQMVGLAFWNNGFKQMSSKLKPLITPEDFSGQRFRIMPSKVIEMQFQLLHAKAVPISFNEVYRSLERDEVEGQENTISNIYTKRLYTVQKYMTLSNHAYLGYAVVMNKAFWEKLPWDIQSELAEAMRETTEWANRQAVSMNERQLQELKATGLQIHQLTPKERQRWEAAFQPIYDHYAPVIGRELMDKIAELRKQRE